MKHTIGRIAAVAAATIALCAFSASGNAKTFYKMGTFPPGTTVYIVMTAFANAVNKYVPDTEIQVSSTGPATQHMLLVTEKKMDFALYAQTAYRLLYKQIGPFKRLKDGPARTHKLAQVFNYPIGLYQFVVYESSGIKSLADIKGKKVFIGPPGGVATRNVKLIVEAMTGYLPGRDYQQVKMGWGPAAQAFQDRKYDVWTPITNPPSPQVQQIALTNKIRLLGLDKSRFSHPSWKKYFAQPGRRMVEIAPDTYGANQVNTKSVQSTGAWVGLAARASIPNEQIYQMTKAFWDHIDEAHAMAKWMKGAVNLGHATKHIARGLHPGAAKYYREKGIKIWPAYSLDKKPGG